MLSQKLTLAAAGNAADPVYSDDVFSTDLYWGTGSSKTIVNNIDLAGEGGLVIVRRREGYGAAVWMHSVGKALWSSSDDYQYTNSGYITSFNSDGFSLGSQSYVNTGGGNYVAYTFRKCPGFFDVVTYTGNGTAGRSISHSIGSTPGLVVVKNTSNASSNWQAHFTARGANSNMRINASSQNSETTQDRFIRSASSSSFTVGDDYDVNYNGHTYVAYIWADNDQSFGDDGNEAIIKCGHFASYSGEEVVGFEPEFILKMRTTGSDTEVYDRSRGFVPMFSTDNAPAIYWNKTNPESYASNTRVGSDRFFKMGNNVCYMAIARSHKEPTAATDVFKPIVESTNNSQIDTGFKSGGLDLLILHYTGGGAPYWIDRNRGLFSQDGAQLSNQQKHMSSALANGQSTSGSSLGAVGFSRDDQYTQTSGYQHSHLTFKRAKGFFDIVTYAGNGTNGRTVTHNLGVVPEMMIVKRLDSSVNWAVYHSSQGNTKYCQLNSTLEFFTFSTAWNNTSPTSSVFTVGNDTRVNNSSGNYAAYLFATLDGISKVGSYSGTGSNIDIDCGFTAGARFVLIKRADNTGDWYYWQTALGINSGDDPYLRMNSTGAKVTNTDYIDPLNAGFTITSSAPAALNTSGGTYIFLAIA